MKKFVALSIALLLSANLVNAGAFNPSLTPEQKTAAVSNRIKNMVTTISAAQKVEYEKNLEQVKANVPVIVSHVKTLVPKIKEIATKSSEGGFGGFASSVVSAGLDSSVRTAAFNLVGLLHKTTALVIKLSQADVETKQRAKEALSFLAKDPSVKELLAYSKEVPVIGAQLHDTLQDLLTDASKYL